MPTAKKPPRNWKLSEHFRLNEFDCKDGTPVPSSHAETYRYLAAELLEPLRAKFGRCTILSGYRTPTHNRSVGGARNSFHVCDFHDTDDVAADLIFARGTVEQWRRAAAAILQAKRNGKGGLGFYPRGGFIHLDTRDYPSKFNGS